MIAGTTDNVPADLPGYVEYCWRLGWSFTPLAGKAPILKGWQKAPRESLEQALAWAAQGNVGLRTGRASGVIGVDLDEYKAEYDPDSVEALKLPASVTGLTGGGGKCLFVRTRTRSGNSSGKLAPAVDVKGDGGQVVFPGSIHPDTGKAYTWAPGLAPWEVELAELPAHLVALLTGPPRRVPAGARKTAPKRKSPAPTEGRPSDGEASANGRERKYAETALRLELHAVATAAVGSRNQTLNKATFYFRDRRRRDDDNLLASLKPAFDGIADAGVVQNDAGLTHPPVKKRLDREHPRVEIAVEQAEAADGA